MNIVLFGKPGSGKGTIAKLLEKEYSLKHVSTGDLLRSEIERDTELGKKIKFNMESGNFVEDTVVEDLMIQFIENNKLDGYVFDGIPRNYNQCLTFTGIIEDLEIDEPIYIGLDCSDETSMNRMIERSKKESRLDANSTENMKRKLEVFYQQTEECIAFFDLEIGNLYKVNSNLSVEEVYESVKSVIKMEKEVRDESKDQSRI